MCQIFAKSISPFKIDVNKKNSIIELRQKTNVKLYEVLNTDAAIVSNLYQSSPDILELAIPIDKGQQLTVELKRVDIFTPNFKVTLASENSEVNPNLGIHYRGKVANDENSTVSISVFNNEISGSISTGKDGNLILGKLKGQNWSTEHIIYNDKFIFQENNFDCETEDDGMGYKGKDLELTEKSDLAGDCIRLFIEVDNDIFKDFGGLNPTVAHVTALMNQVISLYANEGITAQISELKVWNTISPYYGLTSKAMLSSYQSNSGTFNGDLAQLLSYKGSGGKAAGFSGICNSNPDESKAVSRINSTFNNVPTYSWSVMVITHEFGHLWGSRHTHACIWNSNNKTQIDDCGNLWAFNNGKLPEGNKCFDSSNPIIPSSGGTIMSYCHLQSVGINFNLGFGPQPGNIIRSSVANASCTGPCDSCGYEEEPFKSKQQRFTDGDGIYKNFVSTGDVNGDGMTDLIFAFQHWDRWDSSKFCFNR